MKRDFLEGLGLNEDQTTKVLAQYNKDISGFNAEKDKLNTAVSELKAQNAEKDSTIKEYDGQIADLTKSSANNKELQERLSQMSEAMEKQKAESAKTLATQRKDFAIESALRDSKARNIKAAKALLNLDKVSLDDNGTLLGFNDQLKTIKSENKFLFDEPEQENQPTIQINTGGNPSPEVPEDPTDMSLEQQTALYKKDPSGWAKIFKK